MNDFLIENERSYKIWNRECKVKLIFDCYEGEEIDDIQKNAAIDFEKNIQKYTENGLTKLKTYILENYQDAINEDSIFNIFKYVVPKTVYVSKDPAMRKVIGLLCHFRFDEENGIAVKYVDGKITDIGGQQIVL